MKNKPISHLEPGTNGYDACEYFEPFDKIAKRGRPTCLDCMIRIYTQKSYVFDIWRVIGAEKRMYTRALGELHEARIYEGKVLLSKSSTSLDKYFKNIVSSKGYDVSLLNDKTVV